MRFDITKKDIITAAIIGLLVIVIVLLGLYCKKISNKLDVSQHNIEALNDTINTVKMKNGELVSYKMSLILEKNELQEYLDISKQEIKELEKKLDAKTMYIAKMKENIKLDTIVIKDLVFVKDSNTHRYVFEDENQYYNIKGYTDVTVEEATTTITNNEINADLKVGLTDDWTIFVATDNPYIKFTAIDGAMVDKDKYVEKKKKFNGSVALQAGFGAQYGMKRKSFDYGPYIGIGFSFGYNF